MELSAEAAAGAAHAEDTWSPHMVTSWAAAPIGRDDRARDVAGGWEDSVGVRAVVEVHHGDPRTLQMGEHGVDGVQSPAHSCWQSGSVRGIGDTGSTLQVLIQ